MITRTETAWQPETWQHELADSIQHTDALLQQLELTYEQLPQALSSQQSFPLRVPKNFIMRMKKGDPNDPLLAQVLPIQAEHHIQPGYSNDPVGDIASLRGHGLLHKYHGRILLMITGACAIHCRYCFRRNFPYQEHALRTGQWQSALDTIRNDKTISEVIFSGGDPLSLSTERLATLIADIEAIAHIKYLRIHSRLPIVLPSRINQPLLELLGNTRLKIILVTHSNHSNEINQNIQNKMALCQKAGITLLNQSVLLRGINDSCQALEQLSHRLFNSHILPYYLHMLDPAQGTAHFEVPEHQARQLHTELMIKLPGYLVPKLVREQPGIPYKTPLDRLTPIE